MEPRLWIAAQAGRCTSGGFIGGILRVGSWGVYYYPVQKAEGWNCVHYYYVQEAAGWHGVHYYHVQEAAGWHGVHYYHVQEAAGWHCVHYYHVQEAAGWHCVSSNFLVSSGGINFVTPTENFWIHLLGLLHKISKNFKNKLSLNIFPFLCCFMPKSGSYRVFWRSLVC